MSEESTPSSPALQAVVLVLLILVGAVAAAMPYLVTGDERCLLWRSLHCRWWWLL